MILFIGKTIKTKSKTIAECCGPPDSCPHVASNTVCPKSIRGVSDFEMRAAATRRTEASDGGERDMAGGGGRGARAGAVGDCIVCDPEGERIHLRPVD